MSAPAIQVRDLRVVYDGRTVLDVPALDVHAHEILTLVGHNGSGKSTLLRILGLLERPTSGRVVLRGEPVDYRSRALLAERRRMADVLQQPLLCRMSVFQNVALGLRFRGRPRREIEARVGKWLDRFRIAHLRDRQAHQISGGEAQRASLARAFVLDPEILILDEPFAALDPPSREALLDDLRKVLAETRTTTLFATHDRDEALAVGDRLAVLSGGRVAQIGAPEEVFSRPASQEVARFVGVENRISGRVVAIGEGCVRVDVGVGVLDVRGRGELGDAVLVCVRPEDVEIVARTEAATPRAANSLDGTITRLSALGSQVRVHVDSGFAITVLVTKSSLRNSKLAVGAGARCVFPELALHLIRREEEHP